MGKSNVLSVLMAITRILFMEHVLNVMMLMLCHALSLVIKIKINIWKIIKDFIILLGQTAIFTVHKYGFQQYILQSVNKDMLSMK